METSNGIDINYLWYLNRLIASAGSTVTIEAGSLVVLDYALDWSYGAPHLNIRARTSPEGKEPKENSIDSKLKTKNDRGEKPTDTDRSTEQDN